MPFGCTDGVSLRGFGPGDLLVLRHPAGRTQGAPGGRGGRGPGPRRQRFSESGSRCPPSLSASLGRCAASRIRMTLPRTVGSAERQVRTSPQTLKAWDGLSDEELLVEIVKAHAAHESVDRGVAQLLAALRGRGVSWARDRGLMFWPWQDLPYHLGTALRRGLKNRCRRTEQVTPGATGQQPAWPATARR